MNKDQNIYKVLMGVGLGNHIGWLEWMQTSKLKKVKVRKQVVYDFAVENDYMRMTNCCLRVSRFLIPPFLLGLLIDWVVHYSRY